MAMILRGATLIDGTGAPPRPASVVVDGDRIRNVDGDAPGGAERLELEGHTLLPGLIDAHTHLGAVDFADQTDGGVPVIACTIDGYRSV